MEIEVTRPKQFTDKIRDYQLIVDGNSVAKIKSDSKVIISIPDNAEYLQAKIDWCTSPKFYIKEIKSNQVLVKNSFSGKLTMIFALYYITFGRSKYLTINSIK